MEKEKKLELRPRATVDHYSVYPGKTTRTALSHDPGQLTDLIYLKRLTSQSARF